MFKRKFRKECRLKFLRWQEAIGFLPPCSKDTKFSAIIGGIIGGLVRPFLFPFSPGYSHKYCQIPETLHSFLIIDREQYIRATDSTLTGSRFEGPDIEVCGAQRS